MLRFAFKRLLYVVPVALGVTVICFALVYCAPGDPASALIPDNTPPAMAAQIRAEYGLDRPIPVQYLLWLSHVVVGDFGTSLSTQRSVVSEVVPAVLNTFKLACGAIALSCFFGILFGSLAAFRGGRPSDRAITAVGITGMSIPQYWLGMVLIVIFAVNFGILPATGMGDPSTATTGELLQHLILPTLTLAVVPTGIITRSVRSTVLETLQQEFVVALYARGLPTRRVVLHVAKSAAPPLLAILGLQFGYILGGSILVETVFTWPGTGYLLNNAIFMRDLPLIQGTVLVLAMFFVFINLVVDLLQMLLDPRLKRSRRQGD
ncbi:MAG TPA: ABC transporter permease [Stellaceae bacterium]|nr:ABC transporter permease [Stellaceae bacterium]